MTELSTYEKLKMRLNALEEKEPEILKLAIKDVLLGLQKDKAISKKLYEALQQSL